MRLPKAGRAVVPEAKITHYLLSFSHRAGRGKAGFFTRFGFSLDAWETLAKALRQHAATHEVTNAEDTAFGTRYTIEGDLVSPDGRNPLVRTVWFVGEGEDAPRFVTAYPCSRRTEQ